MTWKVYLSGEIHSNWRQQIIDGASANSLPIAFTSAVTNHEASDAAGDLLGAEQDAFWRDHKSSKVNAIRTKTHLQDCDIAIIRFGEKFKQWNAAFDAGYAAALGKPLIILHQPEHNHALKEVDAAAKVVAQTPQQVVDVLSYAIKGSMPLHKYVKDAAE